jgi:hypothetical protein
LTILAQGKAALLDEDPRRSLGDSRHYWGVRVNKPEAIARINQEQGNQNLHLQNTHFANVNARKDVWWFDIPISKITSHIHEHLHLLLYDRHPCHLHHLQIPVDYFRANLAKLVARKDRGTISLELSADVGNLFRDIRPTGAGVEFKKFLQGRT